MTRTRVSTVEGRGWRAFEDAWSRARSRRRSCARRASTRCTPAPTEQALHDALPGWLRELRRAESCAASLAGRADASTARACSRAALAGRDADLHRERRGAGAGSCVPAGDARLLVSARVSGLPGLAARLREATGLDVVELPSTRPWRRRCATATACAIPGPALPFVTRLPPVRRRSRRRLEASA